MARRLNGELANFLGEKFDRMLKDDRQSLKRLEELTGSIASSAQELQNATMELQSALTEFLSLRRMSLSQFAQEVNIPIVQLRKIVALDLTPSVPDASDESADESSTPADDQKKPDEVEQTSLEQDAPVEKSTENNSEHQEEQTVSNQDELNIDSNTEEQNTDTSSEESASSFDSPASDEAHNDMNESSDQYSSEMNENSNPFSAFGSY
ncbi:hypothetical protein [Aeriscardovia aeriphila]|uniref:Uncharacterized protein n=1 Tax=Aeriscardovia aeriphila TaxID=218139 RepID=A0A261FBH3_9BIFI|nr:hypothetical protein [Aeriscardovia aeriphila]NYI25339.1 hypothetical protein [Aeriscardovia aeriphila]OZG56507.1 hypothetical protein AEAE_0995 [Aeriscardovia aeriphila]